jgi:hypothetical protein
MDVWSVVPAHGSLARWAVGAVLLLLASGCEGTIAPDVSSNPAGPAAPHDAKPDNHPTDTETQADPSEDPTETPADKPVDSKPADMMAAEMPVNTDVRSGPPDLSISKKCTDSTVRGSSRESVRRLSRIELSRTIQVSFPSLFEYRHFPDDYSRPTFDILRDYPPEVSEDPNENFNALHSEPQVQAWMEIADWVGGQIAASETERVRYGGDCMKEAAFRAGLSSECLGGFVSKLGRQLFRRPLTEDEAQRTAALAADDVVGSVQIVTAYLLRSPSAMFHLMLGTPESDGRVKLDRYEVAEQLAYDLTNAPPDAELSRAADSGELESLDQVRTQAMRIVKTDLAKDRLKHFVDEWLRVYKIPTPLGDQALPFPQWLNATQYLDNMYKDEIYRYFQYVVWDHNGTFADLMTLPVAFPYGEKIADIYGVPQSPNNEPRDTPDHPGLLTRAGFMASGLNTTSPILRGVMMLRRVLCMPLPSPDATIVASRLFELNSLDPKTLSNEEIVTMTTSPDHCMVCHSKINPYGFLLEAYNPLGIRKSVQEYIGAIPNVGSKLFATFPLPGPQSLSTDDAEPTTFNNPNDLVAAIAKSTAAQACMSTRLFRAIEQRPEEDGDACAIAESVAALKDGKPLLDVFARAVANEDIFWRKSQ